MILRPPRSTLSLHDALPIFSAALIALTSPLHRHFDVVDAGALRIEHNVQPFAADDVNDDVGPKTRRRRRRIRSEEHTSELQSRQYLVCRLLLEKKKK